MTNSARGTSVVLAYFAYCAAALGAGAALLAKVDNRRDIELYQPTPFLENVALTLWMVLLIPHLYGLFAPLLLVPGLRRGAYGYFLAAATAGLITTVMLLLAQAYLRLESDLGDPWFWGMAAVALAIGYVLPLVIAKWFRRRQAPLPDAERLRIHPQT